MSPLVPYLGQQQPTALAARTACHVVPVLLASEALGQQEQQDPSAWPALVAQQHLPWGCPPALLPLGPRVAGALRLGLHVQPGQQGRRQDRGCQSSQLPALVVCLMHWQLLVLLTLMHQPHGCPCPGCALLQLVHHSRCGGAGCRCRHCGPQTSPRYAALPRAPLPLTHACTPPAAHMRQAWKLAHDHGPLGLKPHHGPSLLTQMQLHGQHLLLQRPVLTAPA
mmetsp:Transcript_11896/g.25546  ORF Transcript_11896/g.25546 Transcript_11896/m.25546 type:complete len:223 (+) Transcript_11896:1823-2491(+)